jgi:hypothetical protein
VSYFLADIQVHNEFENNRACCWFASEYLKQELEIGLKGFEWQLHVLQIKLSLDKKKQNLISDSIKKLSHSGNLCLFLSETSLTL